MLKRCLIITVFCFLLIGCKKDPLNGELAQLIGKWEWLESKGNCGTKYSNFCYYTPQSEGYTLQLTFIKKGRYEKHKNAEQIEKGIITDEGGFDPAGPWIHRFCMKKGKSEDCNVFMFKDDTLVLSSYPYDDVRNYFVSK